MNPSFPTPLQLGPLMLPNRVLMAPLPRCRATTHHVPTLMIVDYQGGACGYTDYQALAAA